MAQNVIINNITYADCPQVDFNKVGGGTASYVDTSDANATAGDMLNGKTGYINGVKVTGNIQSKAAATYTPTTSDQIITDRQYLAGAQTIKGDSNLQPQYIADGITIFNTLGTLKSATIVQDPVTKILSIT